MLAPLSYSNYLTQWILCFVGIFLIALGVSMEVMANLVTTAGEGIVLAICKVSKAKFGNIKVIFDITLVCISIILSLIYLGHLEGIREGTIAAAIFVGLITKKTNVLMNKIETIFLK